MLITFDGHEYLHLHTGLPRARLRHIASDGQGSGRVVVNARN